jgi:soluble lytic murein transglycosylase-like protein
MLKLVKISLIIWIFSLITTLKPTYAMDQNLIRCFYEASASYNVPYSLLIAIAKVESGFRPWVININQNGKSVKVINPKSLTEAMVYVRYLHDNGYNYDVGIGQINVWNIKRLRLQPEQLLDPCNNIRVSAYILKENINKYGLTWEAIWRYNGRKDYAYKVYNALVSMGLVARR